MATERLLLRIEGMTCAECAQTIEQALTAEEGIVEAAVSWEDGLAEIEFDPERAGEQRILKQEVFRQYTAEPWLPPRCC